MAYMKQSYRVFLIGLLLLGSFGFTQSVMAGGDTRYEPLSIQAGSGKKVDYEVEIAATPEARRVGLMYRKEMQTNHGMLLDFGRPENIAIWMKNTYLPLDIIYINAKGIITKIVENAKPLSTNNMDSDTAVRAVLELNAGQVAYHGFAVGDKVIYKAFNKATKKTSN